MGPREPSRRASTHYRMNDGPGKPDRGAWEESLELDQAAVSKMESQSDMYLSTLRRSLKAMGAELKIVARCPGGEVAIKPFNQKGASR